MAWINMQIFNKSRWRQSGGYRTGFIEEDFNVFFRVFEQGEQESDLRDCIISTTGVTTDAPSGGRGGEENDCVPQELDIEQQVLSLFSRQLWV